MTDEEFIDQLDKFKHELDAEVADNSHGASARRERVHLLWLNRFEAFLAETVPGEIIRWNALSGNRHVLGARQPSFSRFMQSYGRDVFAFIAQLKGEAQISRTLSRLNPSTRPLPFFTIERISK